MIENTNIILTYIDTEKATIKAIKDFPNMKKIALMFSDDKSNSSNINYFRLHQARDFLEWFEPAWCSICEEHKFILKEFYMTGNLKSGAGVRMQLKLNYSERQLHRIKGKAIADLSKMLFGK